MGSLDIDLRCYTNRTFWINWNFTTIQLLEHSHVLVEMGKCGFSPLLRPSAAGHFASSNFTSNRGNSTSLRGSGDHWGMLQNSCIRKADDFWSQLILSRNFSLRLLQILHRFYILNARIQLQTAFDVFLGIRSCLFQLCLHWKMHQQRWNRSIKKVVAILLNKGCRKLTCWGMIWAFLFARRLDLAIQWLHLVWPDIFLSGVAFSHSGAKTSSCESGAVWELSLLISCPLGDLMERTYCSWCL